jgi:class 3 adenylate cyclase/tetratricopeptide (TPR) repeat protein
MSNLQRHVPRLVLEWAQHQPGDLWRQIDGTLLFADVSGFTALAERLAQRGRVGGEELVETLGRVFGEMMDVARGRGGSLLKFGGDALLLFFHGEEHAIQGAAAAVEMRRTLKAASGRTTSVGPLKLSMSVGLHSGPVDLFLVGGSHRELVVLGEAADTVVATEGAAEAGQILVSTATAERLPRTAVRPRGDGELLLRWRRALPEPPERAFAAADFESLAPRLMPAELGAYLAPGAPDPEHRVACIAFIGVRGTNRLLRERGPRFLAEALNETIAGVQRVLVEEGVTLLAIDVDRDGFKFFLAAGVPYGREDDEGVMLRAARSIIEAELPLERRIGISRGHVFAAEVGSVRRAAYSAMGDTTNTAARIAAQTPPGAIYAHPSVLDESMTVFEVEPAGPLTMKGKKVPQLVYAVGALIGVREREGLAVDTFVGRVTELATLSDAVVSACTGTGGVLSLVGETGLGKTRLLKEAIGADAPSIWMRGEPYGANSSYRMLRDPMRAYLGIEPGDLETLRRRLRAIVEGIAPELLPMLSLLGDVLSIPVPASAEVQAIDPQFRPARTADVLVRLMATVSPGPLIMVVDEAHWADGASVGLLGRLEAECETRPWLLVSARRDPEQGYVAETGERLTIGPMPDEDVRTLVRLITEAAPLRTHVIEAIVRRAGGYPLFAEEIVRAGRDLGSLDALPESLEAAMATQVDALDRSARRVLQFASVLGQSFSTATLKRLLAIEGFDLEEAHLERLEDYLVPEGELRMAFRNGILRDTVYEGIAYRLRRRLHLAAGEEIEATAQAPAEVADGLAMHFFHGGDYERTWRYGCMAGERAQSRYAVADAARFYEIALEASRRSRAVEDDESRRIWLALGEVTSSAGMFDASLEAHRQALRLAASQPRERADTLFRFAKVRDRSGKPSSALRDLTRAAELIERFGLADVGDLKAEIETFRSSVFFGQDRLDEALAHADRAVTLAEQAGAPAPLAGALLIRESACTMLEGPGDGSDLRRALRIYEELGDLVAQGTVLTNLGVSVAFNGQWQEATRLLEEARRRYDRGGNSAEAALSAGNIAELLLCQGHVGEAAELLGDALPVVRAARWTEGQCGIQLQLGHVLIEQGKFFDADELLSATAQGYWDIGYPAGAAHAMLLRAAGRILGGDWEAGQQLLDDAVREAGGDMGMLRPRELLLRAIALARSGALAEAILSATQGLDLAKAFELRYEIGLLSQLVLTLGREGQVLTEAEQQELEAAAGRGLADLGVVHTPRSFTWQSG